MKNKYRKMLEAIFHEACKYSDEYGSSDDKWRNCDGCILSNVQWEVPHDSPPCIRDLCFVIWHDGLLLPKKEDK